MNKDLLLDYKNHRDIKLIAVTDRKNCKGNFLVQLEKVALSKPAAIILREKDLEEEEYYSLALRVKKICEDNNITLILHNYIKTALKLDIKKIHLPLSVLEKTDKRELEDFETIGVSVHSIEEANKAFESGATYITAGHIFETDCKAGLLGRGIGFLKEIVENTTLPVYAIGGISVDNIDEVLATGCSGVCVMSETNKI